MSTLRSVDSDTDQFRMPAVDIFRADGTYLHLEEDWRRGLGWWLVDPERRWRVSVLEAMRLAPSAVAHEVFLEAQLLTWELEAVDIRQPSEAGLQSALDRLRREVNIADASEGANPTATMLTALAPHA